MAKLKIINRYGIIPNMVLNNKNLTWKAKGLYGYIQSKPEDWDFAVNRITNDTKDGRDGTISGIQELEDAGFLVRQKFKNDKGQWDIEYILYDEPVTENPERIQDKTITENPDTENPDTENPDTNKEVNTNKEINNKDIIYNGFSYKIAEKFLEAHIENNTPGILYKLKTQDKEKIIENFIEGIEKLQRIDKYSEKEIDFIVNFLISDNKKNRPGKKFYWLDQIQTTNKLREKNKEKVPYFVVLIEPAKQDYFNNKTSGTLEI